jgi:hypothetical protein
MVTFEVRVNELPPPSTGFSADAVVVEAARAHGCVNLYFVAAGPGLRDARAYVRVRFPASFLRDQIDRDHGFASALESLLADKDMEELWVPSLEDLAKVADERIASLEGTFMAMSYHNELAICDIYRMAPDFAAKVKAGAAPDVTASVRVNLPTVLLHRMLLDAQQALAKIGGV